MTARLRLLLAILVLALVPMLAPAGPAVMAADLHAPVHRACDYPCGGMDQPGHAPAACPCAAHPALAPLTSAAMAPPVSPALPLAASVQGAPSPAGWPPLLRPPRA